MISGCRVIEIFSFRPSLTHVFTRVPESIATGTIGQGCTGCHSLHRAEHLFLRSGDSKERKTPEAVNGRQIARETKDGRGSFARPVLDARGLAETLLVLFCQGSIDCESLPPSPPKMT